MTINARSGGAIKDIVVSFKRNAVYGAMQGVYHKAGGVYGRVDAGPGLSPTVNIDLTSALDSRLTFSRSGTRNAIIAGVPTAVASGAPAFESWDGVDRGVAVEPGFTNLFTDSDDVSNAAWGKDLVTVGAGDSGIGNLSAFKLVQATTANNYHRIVRDGVPTATAGDRQTFSVFVKAAAGATNWAIYLQLANRFSNAGARVHFRVDGVDGAAPYFDDTQITDVTYGQQKLTGNVYRFWISGVWVTTGAKQPMIGITQNELVDSRTFVGLTTDSFQVVGMQIALANGPTGYVATGAATASQAAESLIFNDTNWLDTTQGTFVVEHDCWTGPVIGSGSNTVLTATASGKSAIAWSGTTSDVVHNGGAASSGANPSFSGSDVRLLATSGTTNAGHIRSIKYYPQRLTVEQMQALTQPDYPSTAQAGVLRTVSVDNRLPSDQNTTTGTRLTFQSRFRVKLGAHDCSELRLDFPNIGFAGGAIGNAISISECALERETGVAEVVPVTFSASRTTTIADGAAATVLSDVILPSSFTSLSVFPANSVFWVRVKGSVTTAGHKIPACRNGNETGGFSRLYDPGTVTFSSVDATGAMALVSGSDPGSTTYNYSPILVGKFVSGDPKSLFVIGDSLVEGTGPLSSTRTYAHKTAVALGVPALEMSRGGAAQTTVATQIAAWKAYLAYARVLVDALGTNNSNATLSFFKYWQEAVETYDFDKIIRVNLPPKTTSSDNFATEANQTVAAGRAYKSNFPDIWGEQQLKYAVANGYVDFQSIRGAAQGKWVVNGAANYATTDGTHQSVAADNLMAAEFQAAIESITVA